MENYTAIKERLEELKPYLKEEYGVEEIGIFGSYVHGEEKEDSDLDILVEFSGRVGLIDLIRLENELSDRLGVEVDLVTEESLKPRIRDRVMEEVVYA